MIPLFPRRLFPPPPDRGPMVLAAVLLLAPAGCQLVGSSAPGREADVSAPPPQGVFRGFLEIEGGRMEGDLTIEPTGGGRLEGAFEAPPDLMARGTGRFRNGELRLELRYGGPCPGGMTLQGRWVSSPGTYSGAVEASDCTGSARGTFLFNRRLNSFSSGGDVGPDP